jgi:hexokinase
MLLFLLIQHTRHQPNRYNRLIQMCQLSQYIQNQLIQYIQVRLSRYILEQHMRHLNLYIL